MYRKLGISCVKRGSGGMSLPIAWATLLDMVLLVFLWVPSTHAVERQGSDAFGDAEVAYLIDVEQSLGIQEVSSAQLRTSFTKLQMPRGIGYVDGVVWIRVTLKESIDANRPMWLQLKMPAIEEAQIFTPNELGEYLADMNTWPHERPGQIELPHRTTVFKLPSHLAKGGSVYLRVRNVDAIVVWPKVMTTDVLMAQTSYELLALGFYATLNLMTVWACLWLWWQTKNKLYMLMSAFVASILVVILTMAGYVGQHLSDDGLGSVNLPKLISWVVSHILISAVVLETLRKNYRNPTPLKVYWGVMAFMIVATALVMNQSLEGALVLYRLWIYASMFWLILLLSQQGQTDPVIRKTLIATICALMLAGALRYAAYHGILPSTTVLDSVFYVIYGGLPVLLLQRMIKHHSDKVKDVTRELNAEIRQAKESGRRLETLVAERTAALNEALKISAAALELKRRTLAEQRQFFSTVSHELRTPLAVIDAAATNLQHDLRTEDEQARLRCGRIRRSVDQLTTLIDKCFNVDRLVEKNQKYRFEEIQTTELIYEAYDAASMVSRQHQIEIDITKAPEKMVCNPELTRLALRTLAINAVKYTPPGTRVMIVARRENEGVLLEVNDNGPGLSEDDVSMVFQRFYRGPNSAGVPGTGLGLPLAREMIAAQRGQLTVESGVGKGFAARIWLPKDLQEDLGE